MIRDRDIRGRIVKSNRICSIEGCNEKHNAKELCYKHYQKQYNKQYRQDNKESIAKRMKPYLKKYQQEHKEQHAEYNKQWQMNHKGYYVKYQKQWRLNNSGYDKKYNQTPAGRARIKASCHNRRILEKGLTLAIVQSVYEDNIKKYGRLTCCLCFKPIEFGKDSLEHLTPLSRSGSNDFSNLGISHLSCNKQKFMKTLEEWKTK